jgi:hypothetical protein
MNAMKDCFAGIGIIASVLVLVIVSLKLEKISFHFQATTSYVVRLSFIVRILIHFLLKYSQCFGFAIKERGGINSYEIQVSHQGRRCLHTQAIKQAYIYSQTPTRSITSHSSSC